MQHRDPAAVRACVESDRRDREDIDVGGRHARRAGLEGGDGAQPGAGGDVEHSPTGDGLRVFAQVPPEREPAGPRERPVRQRGIRLAGLDLDGMPERQGVIGEVQADLLETRHGTESSVTQDEGAGRGGHRWTLLGVSRAWSRPDRPDRRVRRVGDAPAPQGGTGFLPWTTMS